MAGASQSAIQESVKNITQVVENYIDSELDQLSNVDFNKFREERLKQMKKDAEQRKNWLLLGHGTYEEIAEEKEFFEICKKSENVVCHFYVPSNELCKIVDHHLKILCKSHIETKFAYINAERCPFLTKRMKITIMPTITMIQKNIVIDSIKGFTSLGNRKDFSTNVLEVRLAKSGIIKSELDPEEVALKNAQKKTVKKTIRQNLDFDSDDDFNNLSD